MESFEKEYHNLICPWCGCDRLGVEHTSHSFRVTCPRCQYFVYLDKDNSMREWTNYCLDIINSRTYPPTMAVVLKGELEKYNLFINEVDNNPINLLHIMNEYKYILEAGNANEPADDNEEKEVDMVNHPTHYETGKYECIEVMTEALGKEKVKGFCICNAFKYLYRCRRKNGLEDVKKAKWYIDKFIALCEEDLNEDN